MKKFICLLLVLVITFSFSACGGYEPAEPTTSAPAVEMNLMTIGGHFQNNEIYARETHEGKRYKITAKVERVSEDYVIVTSLLHDGFSVYLYYNNSQIDFVRGISRGDIITFEGTLKTIRSAVGMDFHNVIFIKEAE